jgi:hypothetical protein
MQKATNSSTNPAATSKIQKSLSFTADLILDPVVIDGQARYVEDLIFYEDLQKVVGSKGGRVSNHGLKAPENGKWEVGALVWRTADSPFAKPPLNAPDETDTCLRDFAAKIREELPQHRDLGIPAGEVKWQDIPRRYENIRITLDTEVTTSEELQPVNEREAMSA